MSVIKSSKPEQKIAVYNKTNGRCAYCGCKLEIDGCHIDHIEPKNRQTTPYDDIFDSIKKGDNNVDNYFISCRSCNSCKSNLSIEEFRRRIYNRIYRLNTYSSEYQIAKRFGLVTEIARDVVFYFETISTNG